MMDAIDLSLILIYLIVLPLNLIGNLMVCLVVRLNRTMKTPMNFLLVNLAVADMIVAIFLLPPFVLLHTFMHPHGKEGNYICKFFTAGNLMWIGGNASGYTLVAIAFERYFAILYPYSNHLKQTHKKVNIVITACWALAVFVNIPLFVVTIYDKDKNTCVESWSTDSALAKIYTVAWFACGVGAPLLVTSVLYSQITRRLWSKHEHSSQSPQLAVLRTRKHVTKILLVVTAAYGIFWLPNPLLYMLIYNPPYHQYGSSAYRVTVLLACLGSSFNPFIYSLHSPKFRKHSKDIVCWFKRRGKVRVAGRVTENAAIQMMDVKNKNTDSKETLEVVSNNVKMPSGLF